MKLSIKVISALLIIFMYSCGGEKGESNQKDTKETEKTNVVPIINLSNIVGKSLSEVQTILGKASKIEKAKPSGTPCKNNPCDKAFFDQKNIEVLFINGKADWITINDVSEYDFNENNIQLLGFPVTRSNFVNPSTVIRWNDVSGIKEISFFNNGSGRIDYIYVKAKTE